jgi:DNA-directed RNA polymerase specialized sigma24 family protein
MSMKPALAPIPAEEDPKPLADLVEQIAARADRAAFARLFAWFAPRLKGRLIRLGASPAQAEDQAVDVMVAVWRQAASFDRHENSVATWIFRIARNQRLDVLQPARRMDGAISGPFPLTEEAALNPSSPWRTPSLPRRLPA